MARVRNLDKSVSNLFDDCLQSFLSRNSLVPFIETTNENNNDYYLLFVRRVTWSLCCEILITGIIDQEVSNELRTGTV